MQQQVEHFSSKLNDTHDKEQRKSVHTSIAVEPFANHRNACDHITSHLEEAVDELQSPLKGSRRSALKEPSLAEKRASVTDRTAKRNVVQDEMRRHRVRRRVVDEIGGRGVAFRRAFSKQFPRSGSISFDEYKTNMQSLGVVLSDEDFRHLWDLCSAPAPQLGESDCSSVASASVETGQVDQQHQLKSRSDSYLSISRLAETVGITVADAFIGSKDKEKERKGMKKAAMVGQKLANDLKRRKNSLRQAMLISDVRQAGVLSYDDFKSCLHAAGIILGDSDCHAVVGSSRLDTTGDVNYKLFLQQLEVDSCFHRSTQDMFQDKQYAASAGQHNSEGDDIRDALRFRSPIKREPSPHDENTHGHRTREGRGEISGEGEARTRSRSPPWEEHTESLLVNDHPALHDYEDRRSKREAISQARISWKITERLPEVRRLLGGVQPVSFESFYEGLQDAGIMLDVADARGAFARALDEGGAIDLSRLGWEGGDTAPTHTLRPSGVQGHSSSPPPSMRSNASSAGVENGRNAVDMEPRDIQTPEDGANGLGDVNAWKQVRRCVTSRVAFRLS